MVRSNNQRAVISSLQTCELSCTIGDYANLSHYTITGIPILQVAYLENFYDSHVGNGSYAVASAIHDENSIFTEHSQCKCGLTLLYTFVLDEYIAEIRIDCSTTCTDTVHCGAMLAMTTNDFHQNLNTTGSDEHSDAVYINSRNSRQPDTTTGNWSWVSVIFAAILDASEIASPASIGGYDTMTTTKPTTVLAAPTLQSELKFLTIGQAADWTCLFKLKIQKSLVWSKMDDLICQS